MTITTPEQFQEVWVKTLEAFRKLCRLGRKQPNSLPSNSKLLHRLHRGEILKQFRSTP